MRGARILLIVLAAVAVLLWLALTGSRDSDLERGLEETADALAHVEAELSALDPAYQALRAQGLVLGLREQHDRITTLLAQQKDERVGIRTDAALDPRLRLPRLRELVDRIDETLQLAVTLHRTVDALLELQREVAPLLAEARGLRDQLAARAPPDDAWAARRAALSTALTEIEQQVALADQLLRGRENAVQGRMHADRAQASLRTLLDDQRSLLGAAGG